MAAEPKQAPPRERRSVQLLLRIGLGIAVLLMMLGFIAELIRGELSSRPLLLGELVTGAIPLGARLMGLGILVLALTPAARVLALLVVWTQERDWKFVAVALAVIATLCAATLLGG